MARLSSRILICLASVTPEAEPGNPPARVLLVSASVLRWPPEDPLSSRGCPIILHAMRRYFSCLPRFTDATTHVIQGGWFVSAEILKEGRISAPPYHPPDSGTGGPQ